MNASKISKFQRFNQQICPFCPLSCKTEKRHQKLKKVKVKKKDKNVPSPCKMALMIKLFEHHSALHYYYDSNSLKLVHMNLNIIM